MLKRYIVTLVASLAIMLSLLGGIALGAHESAQAAMHPACGTLYLPPCE